MRWPRDLYLKNLRSGTSWQERTKVFSLLIGGSPACGSLVHGFVTAFCFLPAWLLPCLGYVFVLFSFCINNLVFFIFSCPSWSSPALALHWFLTLNSRDGCMRGWLTLHLDVCQGMLNLYIQEETTKIFLRCFSAQIDFHNVENRPLCDGICVANHTSPIDVLILSTDRPYSMESLDTFYISIHL